MIEDTSLARDSNPRIQMARQRAQSAQHQMLETMTELQSRVAPKTLARDAWEGAKLKGADLAEDAVDAVRRRPAAATGVAAAVALFLAREPLMKLASRLVNGKRDDVDPDEDELVAIRIETERVE